LLDDILPVCIPGNIHPFVFLFALLFLVLLPFLFPQLVPDSDRRDEPIAHIYALAVDVVHLDFTASKGFKLF